MPTCHLLSRTIDDGDRVLFVGPLSRKLLHGVPRLMHASRAIPGDLDLLPIDDRFDVVVLTGVLEDQPLEVIDAWAARCHDLLERRGRLVLHMRHSSLEIGWVGLDSDGTHIFSDLSERLDPRGAIHAFGKAGYRSRREVRHWATNQIAHVMVGKPGERSSLVAERSSAGR